MAAGLHTLVRNPISNLRLFTNGPPYARQPFSPLSRSVALSVRCLDPAGAPPFKRCVGARLDRRFPMLIPLAAESKHSNIEEEKKKRLDFEADKGNNEIEVQTNDSQESWKQMLESVKEKALELKEKSEEAYEVYSKQAMVTLEKESGKLMIRAEQARRDLSVLAKELSEEGKEYLASAAKNSPDELKDIVETFTSADELKNVSEVRDFHVGIPYGALLALGGFLFFMTTGSVMAIRSGVILGSALCALSVSSMRLWKRGKRSSLLLIGQAAIATILFIMEWQLFSQMRSFSSFLMTFISGAILAFYIYRIMMDRRMKGPSSEQASE